MATINNITTICTRNTNIALLHRFLDPPHRFLNLLLLILLLLLLAWRALAASEEEEHIRYGAHQARTSTTPPQPRPTWWDYNKQHGSVVPVQNDQSKVWWRQHPHIDRGFVKK
eukprot:51112-Eustigmatos_ZCMA.PRE.1